METDLIMIGEAARIIGVSAETLRLYAEKELIKHIKTTGGRRLFKRKDVERFKEQRDKKLAIVATA